jgi:hypothetical protein
MERAADALNAKGWQANTTICGEPVIPTKRKLISPST